MSDDDFDDELDRQLGLAELAGSRLFRATLEAISLEDATERTRRVFDEMGLPPPWLNHYLMHPWRRTIRQATGLQDTRPGPRWAVKTHLGPLTLSTVFLRMDADMFGAGPPVLFESMVFDDSGVRRHGLDSRQYRTLREAERGHAQWARSIVRFLRQYHHVSRRRLRSGEIDLPLDETRKFVRRPKRQMNTRVGVRKFTRVERGRRLRRRWADRRFYRECDERAIIAGASLESVGAVRH